MEVRATGELFQHRYYRINTMILKLTGQWPYQSTCTRSILYAGVLLLGTSQMVPELMAVAKHLDDRDFLIKCITPITLAGFCLMKYFFAALNSNKLHGDRSSPSKQSCTMVKRLNKAIGLVLVHSASRYSNPSATASTTQLRIHGCSSSIKMLMLLNRMRTDWDASARDRDVNTLHDYAKAGRKITILCAVGAVVTCVLFEMQPVVPKIIDVFLRNGTEPGEFSIPVDYLIIDEQKYYFYIVLHHFIVASATFIVVVAHDSLLATCIYHACGLFATLGRKLERIGKTKRSAGTHEIGNALGKPGMEFNDVASCIDRHNEAIEYAELVEATYSSCFFFSMGFKMFLITLTGLQAAMTTMKPHENLRFVFSNIMVTMHLYAECYIAQNMMDHSISIRYRVLDSEWYRLSLKAQKSLLLMVMRCNAPCKVTAGKVSAISIETFGVVLKTSLSYFTVLRSL